MSGMDYTTTGLLATIREDGRIPDADASDTALLAIADRVQAQHFVPKVRKAVADYYLTYDDQDLVAQQAEYRIPYRAATSSVRSVVWVDGSGNTCELVPAPFSERHLYSGSYSSYPERYAIQDDVVVLMPAPATSSGSVRIWYEYTPHKLILVEDAAQITGVTLIGTVDDLTAYQIGTETGWDPTDSEPADLISGTAPFSVIARDGEFDGSVPIIGASFSVASRFRAPIEGDWLCPPGETVFPQIPAVFHPLLAMATAARFLKTVSPDESKELMDEVRASLEEMQDLLSPRQQGRQMKVKSTSSVMRRGSVRKGNAFGNWRP